MKTDYLREVNDQNQRGKGNRYEDTLLMGVWISISRTIRGNIPHPVPWVVGIVTTMLFSNNIALTSHSKLSFFSEFSFPKANAPPKQLAVQTEAGAIQIL